MCVCVVLKMCRNECHIQRDIHDVISWYQLVSHNIMLVQEIYPGFVKYSLMETLNSKGDYVMVEGTCIIDLGFRLMLLEVTKLEIFEKQSSP